MSKTTSIILLRHYYPSGNKINVYLNFFSSSIVCLRVMNCLRPTTYMNYIAYDGVFFTV